MLKLGCHVGMSGKEMMLGSVKDAVAFGANTFMLYTGAPQNTRRKDISELRIQEAHELMAQNGIEEFVVHAPYIINLANTVNPATYEIAVEFLAKEIDRAWIPEKLTFLELNTRFPFAAKMKIHGWRDAMGFATKPVKNWLRIAIASMSATKLVRKTYKFRLERTSGMRLSMHSYLKVALRKTPNGHKTRKW